MMDSLKCPITCEIFIDPVTAQDGHTYEREAITNWLKQNPTSPITREPMTVSSLRPNYIVKKMLEESQSSTLKKHYHFELNIDVRKTKHRPLFQAPGKTIYEAEWISKTGPPIVLLRIDGAKARREAEFYVQLSCHPHIVRTYGMLESEPNTLTLVQEFAPEGDLSELLRERRFRPSSAVLLEIFIQIADAMVCLADNNIVHGDLAGRNVLVFRMDNCDPKGNLVKLTDFGLTRASTLYAVASSAATATMIIIPVRYAAPEILQNDHISNYTEKSDVYSMGVLMWEAFSAGEIPYASIDNDGEVRRLKLRGEILARPNNCNQGLWNIITSCWQRQSSIRPTFKTLKQSLLDLQFEQRLRYGYILISLYLYFSYWHHIDIFSSMNITNNQQPYTKVDRNCMLNSISSCRTVHKHRY